MIAGMIDSQITEAQEQLLNLLEAQQVTFDLYVPAIHFWLCTSPTVFLEN